MCINMAHHPGSTLKILVVDDNSLNRKVARATLKHLGYDSDEATSGREALAVLETTHFDLIFMDVQMPEMDGLQATAAIRARERKTGAHLPIVALTAHAMKGDRERCLEAGMDGYLSKPIRVEELDAVLAGQVAQRRQPARDLV